MSPSHELFFYLLDFVSQTFGYSLPPYCEVVTLAGFRTDVRESQKVKRFRLPFTTLFPVLCREPPRFDESGFVRVWHIAVQ